MNRYLDLELDSLFPVFMGEERFVTSLNIIREVMNVPLCALESILRANSYSEVDPDRICIDEEMLSVFADAYIRKMKNYFLSSVRNIDNLSTEEFTDLNEFCNTFKKQEVKSICKAKWSQIDTELIRDVFMDKVKELTPHKKTYFDNYQELVQYFETCEWQIVCDEPEFSLNLYRIHHSFKKKRLLTRLTHNRFYLVKQKVKRVNTCCASILRRLFVAARYHIFVADDVDNNGGSFDQTGLLILFNSSSNKYEHRKVNSQYRSEQSVRGRQAIVNRAFEAESYKRLY